MENEKYIPHNLHCGQYKPYGDFFRVWDIITDANEEETLEWAFKTLYKRRVPEKKEYYKNIRYGGEKFSDMDYYFAGYHEIHHVTGGFRFTICEPFAD